MLINLDKTLLLLLEKLQAWFDATVLILPNLVLAIIVFALFVWLAKLSGALLNKILASMPVVENVKGIVKSLFAILIYLAGAFSALEVLGLEKTVTSILAGAGLIGLAISLAFQNIAANVISGVIISFRHPFYVGDYIKCSDNVFGKVQKINIPNTILLTDEGQYITVPNKEIWEKNIVNYTKSGKREVEIKLGVSYNSDLKLAIELARVSLFPLTFVTKKDDMDIVYTNMSAYSVELSVNFWIQFNEPKEFELAKSEAIMALLETYKTNKIEIPYPIHQIVTAPHI